MKSKWLWACLVIGSSLLPVVGQTSADLSRRFGPALEAFEVRRGVLVTAKYAGGGKVCEMVIEPRRKTRDGFDIGVTLTDEMVEQLIEELVPKTERGKRAESYGWSMHLGQIIQTDYGYENVEIISVGSRQEKHMTILIKWNNRPCKATE
jgi:hypothetical protein